MSDIMRSCITVPSFLEAVEIHLVETSSVLRKIQEQVLSNFKVHWHKTLDTIPQKPTLIIANEFFDALPVDQYVNTSQGWRERRVDYDENSKNLIFIPNKKSSILDMGTGAGIPGIILAINNFTNVSLIDSNLKKINFIKFVCSKLNIETKIYHQRIESLVNAKFDYLISRALANLNRLLFYSQNLLNNNTV